MPISRSYLNVYARVVDELAGKTRAVTTRQVEKWLTANPGAHFYEAMDAIVEIISKATGMPSLAAAEAAIRAANLELAANGEDAADAVLAADFPERHVRRSLERHEKRYGAGDKSFFADMSGRTAADVVTNTANRQMSRHPGRLYFARVPTGPKACPWCVMLASQGFVYGSAAAAGKFDQWHDNCRCRVVGSADASIEGYDPAEYLRIHEADERIRRMDLPEKAKDALRAAYRDSYMGGHAYGREELDGIFQAGIDSLGKKFRGFPKRRRGDYYESSVQRFLGEIGNAYGFNLSGELFYSKTGSPVGAFPSGKELSAARVFADGRLVRVNALHEIKVPDLLVDGHYIDVKTPETPGGAADRLKRGQKQLASVNEARKEAVLDVSYIASREEKLEAMKRARALINCGKYDAIYVIDGWIKAMA